MYCIYLQYTPSVWYYLHTLFWYRHTHMTFPPPDTYSTNRVVCNLVQGKLNLEIVKFFVRKKQTKTDIFVQTNGLRGTYVNQTCLFFWRTHFNFVNSPFITIQILQTNGKSYVKSGESNFKFNEQDFYKLQQVCKIAPTGCPNKHGN